MKTPVRDQVNGLTPTAYFKLLATLMKDNPPAKADAPMVAKLAKIGIVPGKDFDIEQARPGRGARRWPRFPRRASRRSWPTSRTRATTVNGWLFMTEDRDLRHRLSPAGLRHRHRPRRQPPAGRGLSDLRGGRGRQAVQRREQVRDALPQGPDAAGQRLLVADDVQRRVLLRRQPAQPLHASARAEPQSTTPTARWTSTSRTRLPARTRNPTGCPPRRASSS